MSRILIATISDDIHAFAVAEALRRKGAQVQVWCTSDFPRISGESIRFQGRNPSLQAEGVSLGGGGERFTTVWHRRIFSVPDIDLLHIGDRAFAARQCDEFRRGFLSLLCPDAFWVNRVEASHQASRKIFQHYAATQVGLATPETLFSNDPEEIRRFIASVGGRAVFKTLTPAAWHDDDNNCWAPYTVSLRESDLVADNLLRQTPAIFQNQVDKDFEVRVTIMGRAVFAAKVRSQETSKGQVDWRLAYDELVMEQMELPEDVAECCLLLMSRLGLVFGCFDFIVTPEGDWVFLEVNEMGQFLFVELYTGMPLLDAFSEFLLQANSDFLWQPREPQIRFPEVQSEVRAQMIEFCKNHIQVESPSYYDGKRT